MFTKPEQTLLVQWVKSSNLLTKTFCPEGSLFPPIPPGNNVTGSKLYRDTCQMYYSVPIT
jgi:hypothetical protein